MRTDTDTPLLLSQAEVARLLRCTTCHVRRLANERRSLPTVRFSDDGRPRYRAEDVEALVRSER
jgi:hypothetical protein